MGIMKDSRDCFCEPRRTADF